TTTVSCSATDSGRRTGHGTFAVLVHDTTAPAIGVPHDITKTATAPSTPVSYAVSFTDAVSVVSSSCVPQSGSGFAVGITTVTCPASAAEGNTSHASFRVTIVDPSPPVINGLPGPQTKEATGPGGVQLKLKVTVEDRDDGGTFTCTPGSPVT